MSAAHFITVVKQRH